MHLQFIYYYKDKLKKTISENQFQDIKEALTVRLNIEFSDLLKEKDKGYPDHQKLRNFIEQEWTKDKDLDIILNKCIDFRA